MSTPKKSSNTSPPTENISDLLDNNHSDNNNENQLVTPEHHRFPSVRQTLRQAIRAP